MSYIVIFCNFLVFAEDPVSHSKMEADIPVVGNVFSFVGTKYPPDWRWRLLKVKIWLVTFEKSTRSTKLKLLEHLSCTIWNLGHHVVTGCWMWNGGRKNDNTWDAS